MKIYKITCLANNKIYIGQTTKALKTRLSQHICDASRLKDNTPLHNAINKYGKTSFVIEEIDSASTRDELSAKETYWIKTLCSNNNQIGYNASTGGESPILNEDSKKKISLSKKGVPSPLKGEKSPNWKRVYTPEEKQKIKDGLKRVGFKPVIQYGNKSMSGKNHTTQAKEKISASIKQRYNNNPAYKETKSLQWTGSKNPNYKHIEKELLTLYINEGKTVKEIAAIFNVRRGTIYDKMKLYYGSRLLSEIKYNQINNL